MKQGREPGLLEPVGPFIRRVLRACGLEHRLHEFAVVEAWPEVVGATIAQHARALEIRDGVLFVDVGSSVWMQELGMLRDDIAARLNARLGAPLVRKVVLSLRSDARTARREREVSE